MASSSLASIFAFFAVLLPAVHCWGIDGHFITCRIAQGRLSEKATDSVNELLPNSDLASLCSWADNVRFRFHWSAPLHYIDTPDDLCNYRFERDCKDEDGTEGRCVSGAITNYTNQLLSSSSESQYNKTQALLFLSHFVGDIHQPLHVGFTTDRGGNTIDIHWFRRKSVLHHAWDANIIETAEKRFYDSDVEGLINDIKKSISGEWADHVSRWESCASNKVPCPDIYAAEGIKAACDWAYKNVTEGETLEDDYFLSRLPIVKLRLAEGGVRLAATLNRIFA